MKISIPPLVMQGCRLGACAVILGSSAAGQADAAGGGAADGTNDTDGRPACSMTASPAGGERPAAAPPVRGPVDAIIASMPPNSWKALPGTKMKEVCPAPYNRYACEAVMAAWSGGAYDEKRDRMVIYGGGHADSWYNNVFAFDLAALTWLRLTEMSGGADGAAPGPGWSDSRLETCGFYPKGVPTLPDSVMQGGYVGYDRCFVEPVRSQLDFQQPRSAHTYGGLFVDVVKDRYCSLEGAYYPGSQTTSPVAVCFSPATGRWSRMADRPLTAHGGVGARGQAARDAAGHIWSVAGEAGLIGEYDPVTDSWKTYGFNNDDAGGGADIDRMRNQLLVLHPVSEGRVEIRRWNLDSPASLSATPTYSVVPASGTAPTGIGGRPGFVYADARDRFFAWGGGRDVFSFDPATRAWSRLEAAGDDPGPQQRWGTNGRFRYSPLRDVFVLANGTTSDVYLYKPPVGACMPRQASASP